MFIRNKGLKRDGKRFPSKGRAGREEKLGRLDPGQIGLGEACELFRDFVFGKKIRFGELSGSA